MTYDSDPPRLRVSGHADDPLVQALEDARRELPTSEQLAALAARVIPSGGRVALRGARISLGRARLRAKSMQAAAVALALAMGVGATVMMRGRFSFTAAPKVETKPPSPPRAVVPHEKPPQKRARTEESVVAPSAEPPKDEPPPTEVGKHHGVVAQPSAHHVLATDRPSRADLPSSDVDGLSAAEDEAALLGRAQQALSGNPASALALTEEHRRAYPSGALGQESEVIAIEALAELGRVGEARSRADVFRAKYPSSAHLRRIDRLLGAPGVATPPSTAP